MIALFLIVKATNKPVWYKVAIGFIVALFAGILVVIYNYVLYLFETAKIHKKAIHFFEKLPFKMKEIYLTLNDKVSNWEGLQRSSTRYNQSMPIQENRGLKIVSSTDRNGNVVFRK
jgi:cell shape-determining protein MreC